MFSFLGVVFICLILVISLSILAFGDTKDFQKLRQRCNICPTAGDGCEDRCLDFISSKLSDKCRVLPQEIEMLNDHLRGISEMVYVIGEMHKCYQPGMQSLKCQLLENAKEIMRNLPRDMPGFLSSSNPLGGKSADMMSSGNLFSGKVSPSKSPPHFPSWNGDTTAPLRLSALPSPTSPCSLSREDVGSSDSGPCRYVHCDECFQQSAIDQAIQYLINSLKEEC